MNIQADVIKKNGNLASIAGTFFLIPPSDPSFYTANRPFFFYSLNTKFRQKFPTLFTILKLFNRTAFNPRKNVYIFIAINFLSPIMRKSFAIIV